MFFRLIFACILLLTGILTASAQKDSISTARPKRVVETPPDKAVESLIDSVSVTHCHSLTVCHRYCPKLTPWLPSI